MSQKDRLSICIVTYNSSDKVGNTVATIKKHTKGIGYRLYVSDNGSSDATKETVMSADTETVFIENGSNIGFGKANNKVLPLIESEYHAIINPDIILGDDVLSQICGYLDENPEVAMVTPKILFPDGTEQHLPKRMPTLKYLACRRLPGFNRTCEEYTRSNEVFTEPTEIEFCTGCFSVIRTDIFKKLGGFDERFFMYFEDTDLTLRAAKYGKTVFLPQFHAVHFWERSSTKSLKYFMIHVGSMFKFLWKYRKGK